MYFFTSDEHLGHGNIIRYCNRPFDSVEEMDNKIISNHNEVVGKNDIVIHAGDFTLKNRKIANRYISKLNGNHIFLKGSHDYWLGKTYNLQIWDKLIENELVVVCHYAMRVWARSHYNSWHLYGHSHGDLKSIGKSLDIGVDTNNFYPYSFESIKTIMNTKPNNINYIRRKS